VILWSVSNFKSFMSLQKYLSKVIKVRIFTEIKKLLNMLEIIKLRISLR